MKKTEALKLALDALEVAEHFLEEYAASKYYFAHIAAITAIKEALAQPEQEPVAWKLVPIKPTREMLIAMDECSTEGYDERLYAGHAASVYMAAVDVAPNPPEARNQEPVACVVPYGATMRLEWASVDAAHNAKIGPLYTTPPQRKPLTDEEIGAILEGVNAYGTRLYTFARAIEAKLKEKNT